MDNAKEIILPPENTKIKIENSKNTKLKKKKKPEDNNVRKMITYVTFYIEDILEIEELLKQNCEKYEISSDEYEAESIEDFSSADKKYINRLSIITKKPDIQINFDKLGVNIYSYNTELSTVGLISKIEAIINKKRSYFRYIRNPNIIILAITSLYIVPHFIPNVGKISLILLLLFFISNIYLIIIGTSSMTNNSTIYSIKKDNHGFLSQNKDKILLHIINSLISGIVGFILGIIFNLFKVK